MDRRCGNTNNLGAIFGVLSAIGVPVPQPGTIGFTIAQTVNRVQTAISCAPRPPHLWSADPAPRVAGAHNAHTRKAALHWCPMHVGTVTLHHCFAGSSDET